MRPNEVTEPLEPWVERVIDRALLKHMQTCPVALRVAKIEIRLSALVGFMLGSGLLGGAAGAMVCRAIGG
ncbi:MAG: hypothetical protein NTX87_15700 [Planctomycetota bacterium]|nr:hypothetical protein [Planctomycetota bacterium]